MKTAACPRIYVSRGTTMSTKGEGDKMYEILTKYSVERKVDEADEEILDRLALAKFIEYSLKEGGAVYAKATRSSKGLFDGSQRNTS